MRRMCVQLARVSASCCVAIALSAPLAARAAEADPAVDAATPPADSRGASGLRADLERIVASEESSGWFLDRSNYLAIYPIVLQSVCSASESARTLALRALREDSSRVGDSRDLFEEDHGKTSRVDQALHLERMQTALARAAAGAALDCPFWVAPKIGYDGRQTDRNRFTLSLETGGLVQLRRTDGAWGYGGGGGLRILPGYGFGKFSLLGGVELAGGALTSVGSGASVVINYLPAIPIVLRVRGTMWHFDVELAALGLFQSDNQAFSYGFRTGVGFGLSGLKSRFFIPWAGLAVAYDYFAEGGGRPVAHFLRGGLRLGFQWDP